MSLRLLVATILLVSCCPAAGAMSEARYTRAVEAINRRYEPVYSQAAREAEAIERDSQSCILEGAFEAQWETTEVSFDVPEIRMRTYTFTFQTVDTTFDKRTFATLLIPRVYYVPFEIEKGVELESAVIRYRVEEIETKVPGFELEGETFETDVPEFELRPLQWSFRTMTIERPAQLDPRCERVRERAQELRSTVEETALEHRDKIHRLAERYLEARAREVVEEIPYVEREFDLELESMYSAIAEAARSGLEPDEIVVDFEGRETTLVGARRLLAKKKTEVLALMCESHKRILRGIKALRGDPEPGFFDAAE